MGCFNVGSTPLAAGLLPLPPRQIEWQCKRQHRFPQKPCCARGDHPLSAGPPIKRCHYSCSSEQLLCRLEFALQLQLLSRAVPVPAGCAAAPAVLGSSACTDCTLSSYLSPERKSTSLHSVWCSSGCRPWSLRHCCLYPFLFHCSSVHAHSWTSTTDRCTQRSTPCRPTGVHATAVAAQQDRHSHKHPQAGRHAAEADVFGEAAKLHSLAPLRSTCVQP